MAQRRMFSKTITNSDKFLEMPDSTQNLYFHLNMEADDDGFIDNWKSIMRMTGKKEDDLKLLIAKSFIIPFENGIIVIKHWRINNYLRKDRYSETKYIDEKNNLSIKENGEYILENSEVGIPSGIPPVDADKYSIGKYSIVYNIYEQFDRFWEVYPKHKNKANALKWFEKNKPNKELVDLMIEKIKEFKLTDEWTKNNGQFIPYPSTWLNQKRWEDELNNPKVPEWFSEEPQKEEITREEEQELKDLLKNFD